MAAKDLGGWWHAAPSRPGPSPPWFVFLRPLLRLRMTRETLVDPLQPFALWPSLRVVKPDPDAFRADLHYGEADPFAADLRGVHRRQAELDRRHRRRSGAADDEAHPAAEQFQVMIVAA